MPTDRYFDKFPTINYNNNKIVDITKRTAVLDRISRNPYIFYPYEIVENERADQLSNRYYKDSYKSWMIYLANKITDPYYEWYLSETEFAEFLVKKYGSLESAQEKIYFYRNDWPNSEPISVSRYDALTELLKAYWEPSYGASGNIISYTRQQKDWTINTNQIVKYDNASNTSFIKNEVCDVYVNSLDPATKGRGQILSVSDNTIFIQHTSGTVTTSNTLLTGYIYGQESKANSQFTLTTSIVKNLAPEEEIYWTSVTYFQYETEKNEFNKTVRLIDNRYSANVVINLKDLMGQ